MFIFWEEPRKRKSIGKSEWEVKKKILGNKCVICNKTDKQAGGLVKAHIKAHSRGGSEVVPMCAICHKKYDSGLLTTTQLKKLGLSPTQYKRAIPKKKRRETGLLGW